MLLDALRWCIGIVGALAILASPVVLPWAMWSIHQECLKMARWRWERGIYTKWEARRMRFRAWLSRSSAAVPRA